VLSDDAVFLGVVKKSPHCNPPGTSTFLFSGINMLIELQRKGF
jgi:hypothetical protein